MKSLAALVLVSTAGAALAQRPPAAPPVDDRWSPARYGYPYRVADYASLVRYVEGGVTCFLYVGVKDESVGKYESHLRVPSGFMGIADGAYECYAENGRAVMKLRTPAAGVPAAPFTVPATPTTPATTVPHAAGASFWFPGLTPTAATTTGAPRAGRFGTTSCST